MDEQTALMMLLESQITGIPEDRIEKDGMPGLKIAHLPDSELERLMQASSEQVDAWWKGLPLPDDALYLPQSDGNGQLMLMAAGPSGGADLLFGSWMWPENEHGQPIPILSLS